VYHDRYMYSYGERIWYGENIWYGEKVFGMEIDTCV